MLNLKRFVIFATNVPEADKDVQSFMTTNHIGFKKVKGSFQGSLEESYVAVIDDDVKLDRVFSIAAKFNQKCILVVDELRKASLHDVLTGDVTPIGSFKAVTALEAQGLGDWTLDGTQYYAVV